MSKIELSVGRCILRHPASRSTAEGDTANCVDYKPQIYINCGCWQGGRTDFALVAADEILLGTWGNFNGEAEPSKTVQILQAIRDKKNESKLAPFFENRPLGKGTARAFPVEYWRVPVPGVYFTDPGKKPIVFIGDCHVHLFREWQCDNFVRPKETVTESGEKVIGRVSLADDLTAFINHASPHADKIVQVGDLYEIWEVQAVFELAWDVLVELLAPTRYTHSKHDGYLPRPHIPAWMEKPFPAQFLSDASRRQAFESSWESAEAEYQADKQSYVKNGPWDHRPPVRVALPEYFGIGSAKDAAKWATAATPREVIGILYYRFGVKAEAPPSGSSLATGSVLAAGQDQPLAFLEDPQVKARIKQQFDSGFWAALDKVTVIQGNHDTDAPNKYLLAKFPGAKSKSQLESDKQLDGSDREFWDEKAELDIPKLTLRIGKDDKAIVVEHGHAFDPINHDFNYFRYDVHALFDGGYHACRGWTLDELQKVWQWMHDFKGGMAETGFPGLNKMTKYAKGLVQFAEDRVWKIYDTEKNHDVRLVVMGHTHNQMIRDIQEIRRVENERRRLLIEGLSKMPLPY